VSEWKQKRRVMRLYDLTAHLYDMRYSEEQEAKYKIALGNLDSNVKGTALDVGCGTGLLFSHVAATAERVVGVDVSRKLLFEARKRARKFRIIHLVQADADHLPFRNACFNVVFAFTVLQNMPHPKETLVEITRTANHEASIVATGLKKIFSLETFGELLQQAGLRVVSIKDDDVSKCYVAISVKSSRAAP
jgi:ubiquinone/menaquinone biosynthesis C-methylase UbiE